MNTPPRAITLPVDWSPKQALAAFEMIDLVRDHLWAAYGPAIQQAFRDNLQQTDPRQLTIDLDRDVPF
jgi:hypothetical protein